MLDTLTFAFVFTAASIAIVTASPEAKLWLATSLDTVARFVRRELVARAHAQTAARDTWQQVYRESKGAGNWTPAAPFSRDHSQSTQSAAEDPSSLAAARLRIETAEAK